MVRDAPRKGAGAQAVLKRLDALDLSRTPVTLRPGLKSSRWKASPKTGCSYSTDSRRKSWTTG
jgi:hypothetical protein